MKKLFTLALALLVATAGFSQARQMNKVSKKDALTATKFVTRGMETLQNVSSQPNMTRLDPAGEGDLDMTTYDWQTNSGARNWTIVWPDGKVNFAYTIAFEDNFSDRGTGIGTYDYVNDEWLPLEGRIEAERTGFGAIARYGNNGIVVAAHTNNDLGVYIVEDKDNMTPNSIDASIKLGSAVFTHPAVMTSGPNRDIIHVVAGAFQDEVDGVSEALRYWRTSDGQNWDKACVELPFLSAEYGIAHGTNSCYFMETTEDNCLALVINSGTTDGMVLYSYDNGETWERKVYFVDPDPTAASVESFAYPRWTSALWNSKKQLMMAYEYNLSDHEGHYGPSVGGVAFWSEYMPYRGEGVEYGFDPNNPMPPVNGQPFIMDSAYIYQDIYSSTWFWSDASHDMFPEYFGYLPNLNDATGEWEDPYDPDGSDFSITSETFGNHGKYNNGVCGFPVLCKVNNSDYDLVAVWSAMDELHQDNGMYYFKLFAAYSGDGGLTWSPQVHLTNSFMFQLAEFVYPQAAVVGNTLVIAVQMDPDADSYVQGDDADPSNNMYKGLTFNLNDLFPNVGVQEAVSHNTHMDIYPNPATDVLNITLNQNAEIEVYNIMGQKVMRQEGHAGPNSINISGLNSGVYFVNAGSDTQKFIVK